MPGLRIVVAPSVRFAALLGVLHAGVAALGAWLPVPAWPKVAFIAAVAWSLKRCLDDAALLRAPSAIVAISVTSEGKVLARARTGKAWLECELLPSSFVSHRVTILNLRARGTRRVHHVVLCCGNANADDLRRLRVWLRWAPPTP